MNMCEKAEYVIQTLKKYYPPTCELKHENEWQFILAARLSAQCTDVRANMTMKELLKKYPDMQSLSNAPIEDLYEIIRPCGMFRSKAHDIKGITDMMLNEFGGKLPDTMEELLRLPGIGRKTANLILGDIFGKNTIVTDTHCIRISNRLGLVSGEDPYKVELQLEQITEPCERSAFCHRLVHFGRDICKAIKPKCEKCPINSVCDYFNKSRTPYED